MSTFDLYIAPQLRKNFPYSIIIKLHNLFPEENIIDGAIKYALTDDDVKEFFREYKVYCLICDLCNPVNEEIVAISNIIKHIINANAEINSLWGRALEGSIEKIQS